MGCPRNFLRRGGKQNISGPTPSGHIFYVSSTLQTYFSVLPPCSKHNFAVFPPPSTLPSTLLPLEQTCPLHPQNIIYLDTPPPLEHIFAANSSASGTKKHEFASHHLLKIISGTALTRLLYIYYWSNKEELLNLYLIYQIANFIIYV